MGSAQRAARPLEASRVLCLGAGVWVFGWADARSPAIPQSAAAKITQG